MKEREAFMLHAGPKDRGNVISSTSESGAIYNRIAIELPPKSRIFRNSNGFLVISNQLFDLTIIPKYEGFDTYIPNIFFHQDIGLYTPKLVKVRLEIRIKGVAFITNESMEIYEWLDSFISSIQEYISYENINQQINPELIEFLKS